LLDNNLPPGAGPSLEAIAALDGAIAAASANFAPLVKDAENTYLKTSYLSLENLLESVRGALLAQQVMVTSSIQLVGPGFVVVTTLAHSSGGWRSSSFPVGDPVNPQKVAAAATYGLRINLQQLLALVASDDDGNTAAAVAPAPQAYQPAQVPHQSYQPPDQQQPAYAPQPFPGAAPVPPSYV
jgi:hypothetical protein